MIHTILHELANIATWPMNTGKHGAYNFFSGVWDSSNVIGIMLWCRHKNCHHKRCWRILTHEHPDHGWPSCKLHWQETPEHIALLP